MMERRSWMYNLSRLDLSSIFEVHWFIDIAMNHARRTKIKHTYCPCMDCKNVVVFDDKEQIISHLVMPRIYEGLHYLDKAWRR
jgi:hypothetical protein